MSSELGIILVQALYSFKGKNNDELCFKKDDIITITQKEEGGWWEGTLEDKTGWFPSNYVKEYKPQDGSKSPVQDEELMSPQQSQQQKVYRNLVLKDILETERSHVGDMQGLLSKYLCPLYKSEILSENEYKQLVGNLEEVVATHVNLVTAIDEQTERPSREQRVGGAFLTMAPILQNVHTNYCANHPKAVCMLGKYKDELNSFMECEGAHKPGIMVLTTGLSKPFRRLDKYAGMLQEYERHLEEGHPDRGDTQRSSHVYKDMASSCGAVRRQKELELEVLTGTVHGWDGGGENLSSLGDIVHMGSVALLPDHRDRYLVLFPACLIMLAVSPRMSAFIFEGKYHLTGIHVNKLEDNEHHKNAIEITGHMAERIIAVCQTREDQNQWIEVLKQQIRTARTSNFSLHKPSALNPVPPTHVSVASKGSKPVSSVPFPHSLSQPELSKTSSYYCVLQNWSSSMSGAKRWKEFGGVNWHQLKDASGRSDGLESGDCSGIVGGDGGCGNRDSWLDPIPGPHSLPVSPSANAFPHTLQHFPSNYFPSDTPYISRPYTVLTKYFNHMYRKKIITRKLFRLLDEYKFQESNDEVMMRRHRTECTIATRGLGEAEDDSDSDTLESSKPTDSSISSSEDSSVGGYWDSLFAKDKVGLMSPVPKKKQFGATKTYEMYGSHTTNLQKWKPKPKETKKQWMNSKCSTDSSTSSIASNPYGYIRYYEPEESGSSSSSSDIQLQMRDVSKRNTYTKPYSSRREDFASFSKGTSSSCDEPYYIPRHFFSSSLEETLPEECEDPEEGDESHKQEAESIQSKLGESSGMGVYESKQRGYRRYATKEAGERSGLGSHKSHQEVYKEYLPVTFKPQNTRSTEAVNEAVIYIPSVSGSQSMPTLRKDSTSDDDDEDNAVAYKHVSTFHSSILNIPATPIVALPRSLPRDSETETESTPNICNQTIYEPSEHSDDLDKKYEDKDIVSEIPRPFVFKTKPEIAYYMSSCSGDEVGEENEDYYEPRRLNSSHPMTLSRSEPNLPKRFTREDESKPFKDGKYSYHYVHLLHDMENFDKMCNCEIHSHRSSDSGLADVIHHMESCPLRGEIPHRSSSASHSSQFSNFKSSLSSSHIRPSSTELSQDRDSFMVTPTHTPYTSASCGTDSVSSLHDSTALSLSPSATDLNISSYSEKLGDSYYCSGLYAHWWMKASVCPKFLSGEKAKKDYLHSKVDRKPEVPPKPKFLKPSYHIKRGRGGGGIVKPLSRSTSTQTSSSIIHIPVISRTMVASSSNLQEIIDETRNSRSDLNPSGSKTNLCHLTSTLSPESSLQLSRERSFESSVSQMSQATVIQKKLSRDPSGSTENDKSVRRNVGEKKMQLLTTKTTLSSGGSSNSELASLHSFSESCDNAESCAFIRDSSEGLEVDFSRRASSLSLHMTAPYTNSGNSIPSRHLMSSSAAITTTSTVSSEPLLSSLSKSSLHIPSKTSSSSTSHMNTLQDKPALPPKPAHLTPQFIKLQRSKSLPKLPSTCLTSKHQEFLQ